MKSFFLNQSFLFLWIAQAASGLGGTFAAFTVSWLVYQLSDSLLYMSAVWIAFMVPNLLTNLIAGPYIDRLQYKTVMVFSEWLRAFAFLIPGILLLLDALTLPVLFMTAVLIGIAEPLFRPVGMAYVAHILPKNQLQRGNSILEGTMQTMMLLGPALGGALMSVFGPLTIITTIISVMTISGILLMFAETIERKQEDIRPTWFSMFKEGLGFYRLFPVLFWIGILMMTINFSTGAAQPMYLPYIIEHLHGSEFQYGLFMSLFSVGMVVGSFVTGAFKTPKNLRAVMLGSLTLSGLLMMTLGLTTSIWIAIGVAMMQGVFAMTFTINNTTFYQRRVPENIRGRVFAVRTLLAQSGIPLGAGLGGLLAEAYSFTILFLVLGGLILLSTLFAWSHKIFYQLNESYDEEQKAPTAPVKNTV
ncbi:MFS transporter [Evansella halocellulosilytica]|uniref:MFS transporter n=1 Tax=Evansella halocellulosilytica TaxID=2011013 RepID=UPI000BB8A249|nr:MFS transporter [Evansella halocellulosilytica]